MNLNIDPAGIEKLVAEAIVQSALGEKVRKAVAEAVAKSWNNPIDQAVALTVEQVAREIVRSEYETAIRDEVRKRLTAERVGTLVENVVGKVIDKSY